MIMHKYQNKEYDESNFMYHTSCPKCGSHDACAVFDDGHKYCYSCQTLFPSDDNKMETQPITTTANKALLPLEELMFKPLVSRGINEETCKKFKYYVGTHNGKAVQVASYCDDKGQIIGQKIRYKDKSFTVKGKVAGHLFGANLWSGGKKLIITEGEIDCLTVSQLQGNQYPVVSIPNGAQGAKKALEANLEYLNRFDEIILMFDMDKPGREAVEECAKVLPIGKAYVANLPLKDPNECMLNGKSKEVIQAIWQAQPYRPDGIIYGSSLKEKCVDNLEDIGDSVPYPFEALNSKTLGARFGELYVITSGSGMGKSTLIRALEYHFGVTRGEHCGVLALEESTRKTAFELMSINLNKRITLDPKATSREDREKAFNETVGNGNFFLYDHFGSLDSDNLLSKIRYMIVGLGCKRIFLDHISIVVSGMDTDSDGGERKAIDKLMTNLRSLVEETGATLFVISHLKRPEKKGHEEGAQVSLSQLRGSGAIAQLSDMVIGLERNQQGENPNLLTIRVLKNRFSGDTGIGGYLLYDADTGLLEDVEGGDSPFVKVDIKKEDSEYCPF